MTDLASTAAKQNALQKPLPAWIASGVLGMALGGGATFLVLYFYGYSFATPESAGPPGQMMAGMMGSGMTGGGGMGGGMGGGGAGSRGKRNLTTLVGKLGLAGKGISLQLDGGQSAEMAAKLNALEKPEKMTQEEAQECCDELESLLTDEQKATLAMFELPRAGRGGAGGGMMAGGRGGMGGPPGGTQGMGGPPGDGQPDDNNPFREDTNRNRLRSLLNQLPTAPVKVPTSENAPANE